MLRLVFLLFLTAGCYCFGHAQSDFKSSGRCIEFDGVDDYLDLGNILDDLTLPLTVEAWVYVDPAPAYALPIFSSQDNLPLYNGVDFAVTPTRITGGYGDGRGENSGAFRRAKSADIAFIGNKWTHVAMVIKGPVDMQFYVNGIDVGGHYDGSTDLPMSSNSPGDVAKVGQWSPNGSKYFFKGKMDEVRVWNVARTAVELRTTMCQKLKGNEAGLVGNWSFNETSGTAIEDRSPRAHAAGKMLGNPSRAYSGAPLGDNSTYVYSTSWATTTLNLAQGDEALQVHNITGNPEGIHIYYVDELPSQQGNLTGSAAPAYFGVFGGGVINGTYNYRATYTFKNGVPCSIARRRDNSVPAWTLASGAVTTATAPIEIIRTGIPRSTVELGADQSTCGTAPIAIQVTGADASATYLWSTGQTTAGISVSATGKYWVAVTDACGTGRDTVQVSFLKTPTAALGADRISCNPSVILNPVADATGATFLWQDGSTTPQLEARNTGSYWVRVTNACGMSRDTVQLTFPGTPLASLGIDRSLCDASTVLSPVSNPAGLTFQWQDGSTASQFTARGTGLYSVRVSNVCRSATASVRLTFLTAPTGVSLGNDSQTICNTSVILKPLSDPTGYTFAWQNGSTASQLEARTAGTYWVHVSNACGVDRDTVQLTFPGTPQASLGIDRTLCAASTTLQPVTDATGLTFQWQDGTTGSNLVASSSGLYSVRVSNACTSATASVRLSFVTAPTGVSLGADQTICNASTILTPVTNPTDLTFAWQDGSTAAQLEARATGTYWVQVSNACGVDRDTIQLEFPGMPEASLGLDRTVCDVATLLTPVADPTGLTFLWQDGSTAPQLDAYSTGTYWVRVSNACRSAADTLDLKFLTVPMGVSLGEDKALCHTAAVLTPVSDPAGLTFEWQDGSAEPQLEAKMPGIYWVLVRNVCGVAYDTIAITKKTYSIPLPPNVITPNGDDKNETFVLPVEPDAGAVKIVIYNRWGQQVYASNDYKNTWTGAGLASGVYFYNAGGECIEGIKGVINILR